MFSQIPVEIWAAQKICFVIAYRFCILPSCPLNKFAKKYTHENIWIPYTAVCATRFHGYELGGCKKSRWKRVRPYSNTSLPWCLQLSRFRFKCTGPSGLGTQQFAYAHLACLFLITILCTLPIQMQNINAKFIHNSYT